jgi:hypothetical protein
MVKTLIFSQQFFFTKLVSEPTSRLGDMPARFACLGQPKGLC